VTLGLFMPLITAFGALLAVPLFVWQLRRLPGQTDPGYDEAAISAKARAFKTIIAVELAVPVLLYIMFNLILPEEGAMVLF
jgi:ABC-type Fe3+ transport system permease subunit